MDGTTSSVGIGAGEVAMKFSLILIFCFYLQKLLCQHVDNVHVSPETCLWYTRGRKRRIEE